MTRSPQSILFLGKEEDPYCAKALAFCQANFEDVTACLGVWGDPLPKKAAGWRGDLLLCYRCQG